MINNSTKNPYRVVFMVLGLVGASISTLGISVASALFRPLIEKVMSQTGLYIGTQLNNIVGNGMAPNSDSYINNFLTEALKVGVSAGAVTALFSGVGKEVYSSYVSMQKDKQQEPHTAYPPMFFVVLGFVAFALQSIGILHVQEYIQNTEPPSPSKEDALNLLRTFQMHEKNVKNKMTLYNYIVEMLYKDNEYYSKTKGLNFFKISTYNITNINVFRVMFNVLIGLSSQINRVFGTKENQGVKSFKWFTLLLYVEALAVVLKIPSVAPLYSLLAKTLNVNTDYLLKTSSKPKSWK